MQNFDSKRWLLLVLFAVTFLFLSPYTKAQSFSQTVPSGYMNTSGGSSTFAPFNANDDSVWQWAYDSSQFNHAGPILINELYVRLSSPTVTIKKFDFDSLEIMLIEASNDTTSLSLTFADNVQRGEIVRTGSYLNTFQTAPSGGTACWVPLRLNKSFLYDPTSGNDLIVRVRTCNVNTNFGFNIDCVSTGGGIASRVGNQGDCTATIANIAPDNTCPILKLDYTPVLEQTLPAGHLSANSNNSTSNLGNTGANQIWQWHYDSTEFNATGPITISELSIRADDSSQTATAFNYTSFEVTLIEASTDYRLGFHSSTFAQNISREKVVRSGPWTGTKTLATGLASSTWISLQLAETFDYDPTSGNDLIIQIRSCNVLQSLGIDIDAVSGFGGGSVGGNQYGHPSFCSAIVSTVAGNELVPVVKVSYTERTIDTFPYKENFDNWGPRDNSNTSVPPGWKNFIGQSVDGWFTYSREHNPGTATADHTTGKRNVGWYMSTEDSNSNAPAERLETPIFDLSTINNPMATFWVYSFSDLPAANLDENEFQVDVTIHDPNTSPITFGGILDSSIKLLESSCWTKYSIDLSPWMGQKISLSFRASTDSDEVDRHDFAIDDLCIQSRLPDELGQSTNANARLDINDCWNINGEHVDPLSSTPGPFYAPAKAGGTLNIECSGGNFQFQPVALWLGPLNINVANFGPNGQMDTGTPDSNGDGIPETIFVIGNGTNLTPSLFDLFFFTGAAGTMDLKLQVNQAFPAGVLGTFQAVVGNGSAGLFLSNAVVLEIIP